MIEVGAGFHQDLTGRENIYLNGVILGMSREEVRRKFDDIVEFSGLAEFIDTPVKRYSSGMFARLGFSVAAHLEPDILIIDEVLSVGDYLFQTKGVEKMKQVARSGATVIFVSHNLRAVSELCPRTLLLKRGSLIQDGPTSDVIATYMRDLSSSERDLTNKDVFVEEVALRGESGPKYDFDAGERAWLDVRVKALRDARRVAVGIHLLDDKFYIFFNSNSARLGLEERDMKAGDTFTVTFDLTMHLAAGTFHFGVVLFRFDIEHMYDLVRPAATVLVRSPMDVRGAANLYPSARFVS
jgi:lipopolysaccharide transport system ATP-binding protein